MVQDRVPLGIVGLDRMIEGGIPKGRIVIVVGGPGTGKTLLGMQFVINGIKDYNENGIFVSLEESKRHLYQAMNRFSWDLNKLEKSGKFTFVDASPIRRAPGEVKIGKYVVGKRDFSMLGFINTIEQLADSTEAARIVVDPLATLIFQYADLYERRNAFLDLMESLTATGATCLVTMEAPTQSTKDFVEEEYLAHGTIVMQRMQIGRAMTRVIQIMKMRMTAADDQPRPYKIDESGINVFADETLF